MPYKDPEMRRQASRESTRRYRERVGHDTDKNRLYMARAAGKRSGSHRFIGVDGEGYTDEIGQHHYMALVVGDRALYTGSPLSTRECLDFLLGFPDTKGTFHVGFFFDYDVTMILRDILHEDPEAMKEIVAPSGDQYRKTIHWDKYRISYIPRKRLTVRLYGDDSRRFVVHDTRAFFQMSFVKALKTYGVTGDEINENGDREIDLIESMKTQRSGFQLDRAREIISYCKMECRLLAELMGVVRDRFAEVKLDASPYEGPGPVAGKVLKAHGFKDSDEELPRDVRDFARRAYYGGRFEIAAHGTIPVPVFEYDIKSAYPYAMTKLPCLRHGVWTWEDHTEAFTEEIDGLWCGFVSWNDIPFGGPGQFGPLPFRMPDGRIMFPGAGSGWYWSVEIPDYALVHGKIMRYHQTCNCEPFSWVEEMFNERAAMEAERKGSGIALKLVLNSMYGKLAQRVGARPYFNSVWSSLITAITRARIREIYDNGYDVVMFATDAVFTLQSLSSAYNLGDKLGDWELAGVYNDLTIFQPGVYFDGEGMKSKTRGVPMREVRDRADEFVKAANTPSGEVRMQMSNHLGLRQCIAWGPKRYQDLGNWLDAPRTMRVDPTLKRRLVDGKWTVSERGINQSWIIPGYPGNVTTPYDHDSDEELDAASNMWEEGLHDADDDGLWLPGNVTTRPNTPSGSESPKHDTV